MRNSPIATKYEELQNTVFGPVGGINLVLPFSFARKDKKGNTMLCTCSECKNEPHMHRYNPSERAYEIVRVSQKLQTQHHLAVEENQPEYATTFHKTTRSASPQHFNGGEQDELDRSPAGNPPPADARPESESIEPASVDKPPAATVAKKPKAADTVTSTETTTISKDRFIDIVSGYQSTNPLRCCGFFARSGSKTIRALLKEAKNGSNDESVSKEAIQQLIKNSGDRLSQSRAMIFSNGKSKSTKDTDRVLIELNKAFAAPAA